MYELDSYMDRNTISFFRAANKKEVLEHLINLSHSGGKLKDLEKFKTAIFEREAIVSTGIGLGVAVPHAKITGIDTFFITVGILEEPVDWQAIDDKPVSIVFLIGGPDNSQKDYLGILSKLVLFTKNAGRREGLLKASEPEQVITQFASRT